MLYHFTKDGFEQASKKPGVMLVDFWATWCGPCKMVAPVIEELAADYNGKAVVGKVDVDEVQDLAVQYQVMSIPTVVIFKDGQEITRMVGVRSKGDYVQALDQALSK